MGGGSVGEAKGDSGEGMIWRVRTELGRIKQMEGAKSKIDIHYKFNQGLQRGVTWYEVKKHPGRLLVESLECTKFVRAFVAICICCTHPPLPLVLVAFCHALIMLMFVMNHYRNPAILAYLHSHITYHFGFDLMIFHGIWIGFCD